MNRKKEVDEGSGQLGLLGQDMSFDTLPTAKMSPADKVGVHGWTNFYAAFSSSFVTHALTVLQAGESDQILDPFCGSGTTLVAALKLGIPAIGVDLDPFSCLLSRAKISTQIDARKVRRLLRPSGRLHPLPTFDDSATDLFDTDCLNYASSVISRVVRSTGGSPDLVLNKLLRDKTGKYDSEVVAVTALCVGASKSANLVRGSNPTWYRKGVTGEKDNIEALLSATKHTGDRMVTDLESLRDTVGTRNIRIFNSDVTKGMPKLGKRPITHIVTSPPYLTRMDYVVKHLPHLLILGGMSKISIDHLRNRMIGTPRIVSKGIFDRRWGPTCVSTLELIESHPSYASSNYYIWTYFQYFQSLFSSLMHIIDKLSTQATGLVVVQDSYYKDIHVPLSRVVVEMLTGLGCDAEVIRQESVRPKLQQLNPAHKHAKRNVKSSEDAVLFRR